MYFSELWWFSPQILIFQELLIVGISNQCHWIQHTWNPIYMPLNPFWCNFPSQNQQNVKFLAVCLTPHTQENIKKMSILTGKKCSEKAWISATYRFLGVLITMHYVRSFVWQVLSELWCTFLLKFGFFRNCLL